jgi:hypothetical protein
MSKIPKIASAFDIFHSVTKITEGPIERVQLFRLTQNSFNRTYSPFTLTGMIHLTNETDYLALLNLGCVQVKVKDYLPFQVGLQDFYSGFEKRSLRIKNSRKILLLSFTEFTKLPTFSRIKSIIQNDKVEIVKNTQDSTFYL